MLLHKFNWTILKTSKYFGIFPFQIKYNINYDEFISIIPSIKYKIYNIFILILILLTLLLSITHDLDNHNLFHYFTSNHYRIYELFITLHVISHLLINNIKIHTYQLIIKKIHQCDILIKQINNNIILINIEQFNKINNFLLIYIILELCIFLIKLLIKIFVFHDNIILIIQSCFVTLLNLLAIAILLIFLITIYQRYKLINLTFQQLIINNINEFNNMDKLKTLCWLHHDLNEICKLMNTIINVPIFILIIVLFVTTTVNMYNFVYHIIIDKESWIWQDFVSAILNMETNIILYARVSFLIVICSLITNEVSI